MTRHKLPEISPIVERRHPNASLEEKRQYTKDLQQFVVALFALTEKLEARRREKDDSRKSGSHGNLDSR